MLYLNLPYLIFLYTYFLDLTLTNVVFELWRLCAVYFKEIYLTLTNVVFEWKHGKFNIRKAKFNFNKCCIWIICSHFRTPYIQNLTLTNVVFECIVNNHISQNHKNLTLTNVVFESCRCTNYCNVIINLTLTNVVFEFVNDENIYDNIKFNFNKCCIWICNLLISDGEFVDLTLTNVVFECYSRNFLCWIFRI